MIEREELARWADLFGVGLAQVDRDWTISHLLTGLAELDPDLRFFGGTALCRTYLNPSRLSEDIDLLAETPREAMDEIVAGLPGRVRRDLPDGRLENVRREASGVAADFLAPGVDPVKVYVGEHGPDTRMWTFVPTDVVLRYSDLPPIVALPCPDLTSFAGMKLMAWYDRHAPRDLFDLAGIARHPQLDREAVEALLEGAFHHGFIETELTGMPGLTRRAWDTELGAQTGELLEPDEALRRAADVFTPRR